MFIENPKFSPKINPIILSFRESMLDVLNDNKNLPESVVFGREVKNLLKEKSTTISEVPKELDSVDGFFDIVNLNIKSLLEGNINDLIDVKRENWINELQQNNPKDVEVEELKNVINSLINDDIVENVYNQRFSNLASLRDFLPEAWETLTVLSSEFQLARIALSRKWLNEMDDSCFENLDFSRQELLVQNDLASLIGKQIDHAYIKQDHFDRVLNATESDEGQESIASRYLYNLPIGNEQSVLASFAEVFPVELSRFKSNLVFLANKIVKLLQSGELSESYKKLPEYLKLMGETYTSVEHDKKNIEDKWLKLYEAHSELLKSGCPLMINPQNDYPFTVLNLEVRLGLRSKEYQNLENKLSVYTEKIYELMRGFALENEHVTNTSPVRNNVFLNNQKFAFGPNLQSPTRAECYNGNIFLNVNENLKISKESELPILRRIMDIKIEETEYLNYAILETGRHELGHSIMASEDESVIERIGESSEANIIEELKAETVSMKLVSDQIDKREIEDSDCEMILVAKIGTLLDYLKSRSSQENSIGEEYYLCGVKLLVELLNNNNIVFENGILSILNAKGGIKSIANLGDEILNIYKNMETTPANIEIYSKEVRKLKNDLRIRSILDIIK